MPFYKRTLSQQLPKNISYFLFGPRQTGKTTILNQRDYLLKLDFLKRSTFLKYTANPDLLFDELCALNLEEQKSNLVWLDEVQKVPAILETVHRVMNEMPQFYFALSGSSARKLRRGAANLLGGRAIDLKLFPLTHAELGDDYLLERVLAFGSLPKISVLLAESEKRSALLLLRSYVTTYLTEEIHAEALVQNLQLFQGFLEIAAQYVGLQINFNDLATQVGVSRHYIKKYFAILEDTLIGYFLKPYSGSATKQMSKRPKFYLFDNGVTRAIQGVISNDPTPAEKGHLFEQWVVGEIRRFISYSESGLKMYFWRTQKGAEVDILLCRGTEILLGIECKSSSKLVKSDFAGLNSFHKTYPKVPLIMCCPVDQPRRNENGLDIMGLKTLINKVDELVKGR